jgi:NAD(P)-dependent dehydrogenase (short-subunit alcohol dehydrogenase family)
MPTVLVTGASRGIGRAITNRMAAAGWDVLAGVRDEAAAAELRRTAGTRVAPITLDITSPADVAALADRPVDAVVNNAGVVLAGPVEALALADLRDQLEVNVVAQVAVTQAVLPHLRERGGRVVFISSVSGRVSTPFSGAYNASKFALEGIADALRMELRPWGIPVALVEPGAIDTDIWRGMLDTADAAEAKMSTEHRELYAERAAAMRTSIRRTQKQTSSPDKVAAAVHDALTAQRPRERYLVGADARVQLALRTALPTRAFDSAISRLTGGR